MKRRVLVVADCPDNLKVATWVLEPKGDAVTCATLVKEKATDEYPYVGDVLRDCMDNHTALDAVLLYDPSLPKDHAGRKLPFEAWQKASEQLKTLDADMEHLRPKFEVTTDDPVGISARQEELERDLDAMHQKHVDDVRATLTHSKEAAEALLLRNSPSERGINLIKTLRAEDSPYRNIPIVVGMAYPDREDILYEAGATLVQTSASLDANPYDLVNEAIARQQPAGRWAAEGPKSLLDQAQRPRPPRSTEL